MIGSQAVVAQAFNPSILEAEAGGSHEFEASLVYKVSSRTGSKVTEKPYGEKQIKKV